MPTKMTPHAEPELVKDALLVDCDENDQTADNENTLQFWMDDPSMAFAIVEVERSTPAEDDAVAPASVAYPLQDFQSHAGSATIILTNHVYFNLGFNASGNAQVTLTDEAGTGIDVSGA